MFRDVFMIYIKNKTLKEIKFHFIYAVFDIMFWKRF